MRGCGIYEVRISPPRSEEVPVFSVKLIPHYRHNIHFQRAINPLLQYLPILRARLITLERMNRNWGEGTHRHMRKIWAMSILATTGALCLTTLTVVSTSAIAIYFKNRLLVIPSSLLSAAVYCPCILELDKRWSLNGEYFFGMGRHPPLDVSGHGGGGSEIRS